MAKGPGKSHRKGITLIELAQMFPDEEAAVEWFESVFWPEKRCCGHCGSTRTTEASHATMPYWCSDCRSYFSVRTGTVMERSKIPLQKWAYAIYLDVTNLKGVSAMKLHRDLGIGYKAAWFLQHRIRDAFAAPPPKYDGPIEVDEVYVGREEKNKQASEKLGKRHADGKTPVVGMKDRATNEVYAKVLDKATAPVLRDFVLDHTEKGVKVYSDGAYGYKMVPNQEAVLHSVGEYVRGQAHTNGVESFWARSAR